MPSIHGVLDLIDTQHQEISTQLELFAGQIFDSAHREDAVDSLRSLLLDIGTHFGFEEATMIEKGYPDLDHHRRQHLSLMTELGLLLDRVEDLPDVHALARGADFLTHWYHQHVAHSDRLLNDWLLASC